MRVAATISGDSWPPISCSANSGVPRCTCPLALVWRRSCQRKFSIPDRWSAPYPALGTGVGLVHGLLQATGQRFVLHHDGYPDGPLPRFDIG